MLVEKLCWKFNFSIAVAEWKSVVMCDLQGIYDDSEIISNIFNLYKS